MATNYLLKIFMRDRPDCMVFPIRQGEADRLETVLDKDPPPFSDETRFFWFDTIDGRSVAINLAYLQAVHYLWDAAPYPADDVRSAEDQDIELLFRGKSEPLHLETDEPAQLHDFFADLERGPEEVPYPKFEDGDGETIQINPRELVWAIAPKELVTEGLETVLAEMRAEE